MQLRTTSAFVLYTGSYLPLGLILLVQDLDPGAEKAGICTPAVFSGDGCRLPLLHPWWSLTTVGVGIGCLFATLWLLGAVSVSRQIRVSEAKHIPSDLINYAMPYIVSFMGLDFSSSPKLAGFGVFYLWIFWITYRSGQIVMNPILIAFGWRLFEIKYSYLQSGDALIGRTLFKGDVEPGQIYRQGSLQDVMIARQQDQKEG